jgi:hypothetical protein
VFEVSEGGGVGVLHRFEQRLESAVAGAFAKAFRSTVQPVELAAALQREVDNSAEVLSRDRRLAPNTFGIELSPTDYERLAPYAASLTTELSELLGQHADEQGYVFAGPVTIELAMAEDLGIGRFRVRSTATARVESDEPLVIPEARPARVFLEVNGTKHPVLPPGLVVGRGSEADLRINDPGVSRKHVEIRLQPGHGAPQIGVVDLDSTNGTFLDGERVSRSLVHDGAELQVGHTTITVHFAEPVDV